MRMYLVHKGDEDIPPRRRQLSNNSWLSHEQDTIGYQLSLQPYDNIIFLNHQKVLSFQLILHAKFTPGILLHV